MKFAFIAAEKAHHSISTLCRVLGVTRTGVTRPDWRLLRRILGGSGVTVAGTGGECRRCGAPLRLAVASHAVCLFCLEEQPLASDVSAPLHEDAALGEKLAEQRRLASQMRSLRGTWLGQAALAAGIVVVPGTAFTLVGLLSNDNVLDAMLYITLALCSLLPFAGIAVALLWVNANRERRRLAAHAPATVALAPHGIESSCPSSGAPHEGSHSGRLARCVHCGTTALLPAHWSTRDLRGVTPRWSPCEPTPEPSRTKPQQRWRTGRSVVFPSYSASACCSASA